MLIAVAIISYLLGAASAVWIITKLLNPFVEWLVVGKEKKHGVDSVRPSRNANRR